MNDNAQLTVQRVLVVDDNNAIHEDFRKIFGASRERAQPLDAEAALFGDDSQPQAAPDFRLDSAYQGEEGLALVQRAYEQDSPYALAFVDVRMPPGLDGIETTARIWQHDPDIQIVICTAYSDYSWSEMLAKLGRSDRLVILKKPFDTIEVLQLASALSEKWRLARQARSMLEDLECKVAERTRDLVSTSERLQASEAQYRLLFDSNPHAMWVHDSETLRFLMVNGAALRQYGYTEADFLDMIVPEMLPLEDVTALARLRDDELGQNKSFALWRHRRADGSILYVEVSSEAIVVDGRPACLVLAHDVSQRRMAELELSRIHRALKMLSACNEALVRAEREHLLLHDICRIAVEIGGYRMAWVGYVHEDVARSIVPTAYAGLEAGYLSKTSLSWAEGPYGAHPAARAIRNSEVTLVEDLASDPTLDPWRTLIEERGYRGAVCLPLMGDDRTFGVLTLYSGEVAQVGTDEIKLLLEMADNMAFGIGNIRLGIERRQMQEAVLKIAQGVSAGSGAEFFDLLTTSLVEAVQADGAMVGQLAPGNRPSVTSISMVAGGRKLDDITYALAGTPCDGVTRGDFCLFERGVRELFPQDRMLREMEIEAYAGMPLLSSQGRTLGLLAVFFKSPIQRAELVRSTLRIFGARAASELERQETDASSREQASLLDQAHDAIVVRGIDDRIRYWNKGAEHMFGWSAEEAMGHTIEQLLCDDPTSLHDAVGGVMDTGVWTGTVEHRRKDGSRLTVAAHWTLVRDRAGRPKSILCIKTDITRRLAMERQLEQSQRLEAVGQLTGGVAHDFNNLLTVILGNSELLVERLVDNKRMHQLADMIRGAAQRGAELTNRLLAFARRQELKPCAVDVNQLLAGMEPLLKRTLREDIEFSRMVKPELWQALVDPAQLEGAVLNLCINARDAMEKGGRLMVEAANAWLDQDITAHNPEVQPGEYVMVAVSDTGHGIDPENLKRVFEPFFTTKEFGKGTGLGLSMVYGFIKQSQGHVTIYSEVGQGTTVKMFLPRANRPPDAVSEAAEPLSELRGNETILLAEDNEMVRSYAESQLAELGYRVISVRNAAEALEFVRGGGAIDLLFTDVVMPGGMNGPELVAAARELRPGLKVLYTSGYTDNAIANHGRFGNGVQLLNKPYRRIELARKLRAALALETPP